MPEILFRDRHLAVAIKPPGLLSEHTAAGDGFPDILAAELGLAPGHVFTVHRLDRATGGLMVYALTGTAAAFLSGAIAAGEMEKTYLGVTAPLPDGFPSEGRWDDILYFDRTRNKAYCVHRERRGAKPAALLYRVEAAAPSSSLLSFRLLTGRTHQIRVQCASRALPLLGDRRYGSHTPGDYALWSHCLAFPAPSGERLRFVSVPPAEGFWAPFEDYLRTRQ